MKLSQFTEILNAIDLVYTGKVKVSVNGDLDKNLFVVDRVEASSKRIYIKLQIGVRSYSYKALGFDQKLSIIRLQNKAQQ